MIRRMLAAFAMLGLLFASQAVTAHAQDILGLSLRPTDAMSGAPGRGTVDITRSNGEGNYVIKADMSGAADGMDLSAFDAATDWVVWAVDMDGVRHNIGTLDGDLMLESAAVDYMVARVYVTAEEDANATQPSDPLFSVTLRQVAEVDTVPADDDAADDDAADDDAADDDAADDDAADDDAADDDAADDDAADDDAADDDAADDDAADDEETPAELPTTGGPISDMLMLLAVAAVLLFGGMRMRAIKLS